MADEVGRMQVVLGADTVKHDQALEKSAAVASTSSKAMKKAAQDAADAQARAAKYAADAVTEQGSRILAARKTLAESLQNEKALGRDLAKQRIDEATGSNALAAAIQREVAARKELAAAMAIGKEASHGGFTDQMAASAAVRSLSGNAGIRSVERFLTVIPGVGTALRTLFPLIGAAGLAGLLYDLGEKGYEAFQKIQNAAQETRRAFEDLHDHASVTNDDLALENQHLQDQIDKLSGHPNNGMGDALLELKKLADQLVVSLQEDRKQLQGLLNDNSTGKLGSALELLGIGPNATGTQEKEMLKDQQDLLDRVRTAKAALGRELAAAPDQAAQQAAARSYNQTIRTLFDAQIDAYQKEATRLRSTAQNLGYIDGSGVHVTGTTNDQKIANVEGRGQQLQDLRERELLDESIYAKTATVRGLQSDKQSGTHKAAEAQMKNFEDMLNKRKQDEQLAVVDEINFWEAMLAPAQKYPENVQKIMDTLATLTQDYYRQLDQIAARAVEAQKRAAEQIQQQDAQMLSMMKQWEEQDSRRATSQAKLAEAQKRVSDAMAEQAIRMQVMTGAMSQHDAAVMMAAIHAADYRAQLEELDREAAEDAQRSTLTPDERETRANDRDIRRVEITGEMNRTGASDQLQIENTTMLGAATDALREFTAQALDSTRQIHEFISSTINDVNDAILNPKRGSFRRAGGEILKSGERSLLQEGEGYGLKALGIKDPNHKPKGTQSDPIYVAMAKAAANSANSTSSGLQGLISSITGGGTSSTLANAISGSANTAISGIGGMLMGLGGDTATASTVASAVGGGVDAGEGMASVFSALGDLAFFADGTGPLTADTNAIVGERGPELVNLPRGASVTPNRALPNMGSTHVINIDATGSTDPAQTTAAVHRAIQGYIPGIVSASVSAAQNQRARSPRMSGS